MEIGLDGRTRLPSISWPKTGVNRLCRQLDAIARKEKGASLVTQAALASRGVRIVTSEQFSWSPDKYGKCLQVVPGSLPKPPPLAYNVWLDEVSLTAH